MGTHSEILTASSNLKACLSETGEVMRFPAKAVLFQEDGANAGVFLVVKGRVCLSVQSLPKLSRNFGIGSVLGLPSTFTGRSYSLSATAITDVDVVKVTPENFVRLMREQPELCREATEMLGREVTFIQAALAERRKQSSFKKMLTRETVAIS